MNTNEIIQEIKKHPLCKKNLYPDSWLSGSSTIVYPIEVCHLPLNVDEIKIQWNSDRNCPAFLKWIENKFNQVKSVMFWKSDGSCPSTIEILLIKE